MRGQEGRRVGGEVDGGEDGDGGGGGVGEVLDGQHGAGAAVRDCHGLGAVGHVFCPGGTPEGGVGGGECPATVGEEVFDWVVLVNRLRSGRQGERKGVSGEG